MALGQSIGMFASLASPSEAVALWQATQQPSARATYMHQYLTFLSSRLRRNASAYPAKDLKFIGRLCSGKPKAWGQLVDRWGPRLYSYLVYNTATEADAQDLMRFVLTEVVQATVGSLHSANLTILLFSIAYYHVSHYRQQNLGLIPRRQQSVKGANPFGHGQEPQFIHIFRQFPPEIQQILLLHYVCEVSLSELSQIVGQSEERLARTLYRVKFHLN